MKNFPAPKKPSRHRPKCLTQNLTLTKCHFRPWSMGRKLMKESPLSIALCLHAVTFIMLTVPPSLWRENCIKIKNRVELLSGPSMFF